MSMDCLNYFFDWDPPIQLQDCFIPNLDMIIPETDCCFLQPQSHQPFFQEEAPSHTLLQLNDQFLSPQETFLTNPKTEIFNEIDSFFPTPKRQKLVHSTNFFFDSYENIDFVPEASIFPEFRVPDFSIAFNVGRGDDNTKKPTTLSSQSIAARERRRKIAEKTHELGKLIPGGQKLNTAEMFQAAAKYVKFLQSQVGILQLMQQTQCSSNVEMDTQSLLESQVIQEKLSTEEVCLVPSEMVLALTTQDSISRNPKLSREINKLQSTLLPN